MLLVHLSSNSRSSWPDISHPTYSGVSALVNESDIYPLIRWCYLQDLRPLLFLILGGSLKFSEGLLRSREQL